MQELLCAIEEIKGKSGRNVKGFFSKKLVQAKNTY